MNSIGEVAEQLRRSTVQVISGGANGSGVVWSPDGTLVTNSHVVRGSTATVETWDGKRLEARVVLRSVRRDLAVLRTDHAALTAVTVGDASKLRPGQLLIAVGNPLGFAGALSTGVFHSLGPVGGMALGQSWVRASIRLAPGNSGGPLADAQGRVVGINTMVSGPLGLAVPSDAVARMLRNGEGSAWLGITVRPVRVGSRTALMVLEVVAASPASAASLMAGDILLAAGSHELRSVDDLAAALEENTSMRVRFQRSGIPNREVTVVLGQKKAAAA